MKKHLHLYPAVFHPEKTGYSVSFPDIEGCFTQGDSLEEAVKMASEAMGLALESPSGFHYPNPSAAKDITTQGEDFVLMISFDEQEYRRNF